MKVTKPNPNWYGVEKDLKAIAQLYSCAPDKVKLYFHGLATDIKDKETIFCERSYAATPIKEVKWTDRRGAEFSHMLMLLDLGEEGECWATPDESRNYHITYEFDNNVLL